MFWIDLKTIENIIWKVNTYKSKMSKKPSWAHINRIKAVKNEEFRKQNLKLKKDLIKLDWELWDSCNIYEYGYTISFIKNRNELQNTRLYFSWHWYDQGGPNFWMGYMRGSFNYDPENRYMHPFGRYEINPITKDTFHLLPAMEDRIVTALINQTVLV